MSLRQRKVKVLFYSILEHSHVDKEGCQLRCDTLRCEKWESPSSRQFQDGWMPEMYFTGEGWRFTEVTRTFYFSLVRIPNVFLGERRSDSISLWTRRKKTIFKLYRRKKSYNKNVQKWAIFLTVRRLSREAVKKLSEVLDYGLSDASKTPVPDSLVLSLVKTQKRWSLIMEQSDRSKSHNDRSGRILPMPPTSAPLSMPQNIPGKK